MAEGLPTAAEVRQRLKEAELLAAAVNRLRAAPNEVGAAVRHDLDQIRLDISMAQLRAMPVKKIREVTEGQLRLGAIEDAGFLSIADVLASNESRLQMLPGVGPETARKTMAAARQIQSLMMSEARITLDVDVKPESQTRLLSSVRAMEEVRRIESHFLVLSQNASSADALARQAKPMGGWLRRFFSGREARERASAAFNQLDSLLSHLDARAGAEALLSQLQNTSKRGWSKAELWADYESRSVEYWGLLGELAGLEVDGSAFGFLPQEIVKKVQLQSLDPAFLNVSLRGYQVFGAKFALVQGRVIIGDEMGLGKTIEALAMMSHLRSLGNEHFLVVCPASVIINWTQEIDRRTKLPHFRLHGDGRGYTFKRWMKQGGVAVTTFGTLGALPDVPPGKKISLLVVDEAHYVKNPRARRTQAVGGWLKSAERVLYLTGTPMENRVDEFESLVRQLNPRVAGSLPTKAGVAGATAFRKAVAPVYLRRNQEDVLSELPELIAMDDWVELSDADLRLYRDTVAQGNFMSMRQAAYMHSETESAKLKRLVEIVEESASNDWKVVVFSYFRGVLDKIHESLDGLGAGIIHGGVNPVARQGMVDAFTQRRGPAVLVSQIEAGGVGLNMQAASVVILAEPQWKPTTEAQAIARCHRMGQVRRVHAHRLLAKDYVDQRMLEILGEKARLFEEYVRESALKDATSDAIDITEMKAAQKIVDIERERLGIDVGSDSG